MCTHQRLIYNKYIRKSLYVPCGKCIPCLQQKSNARASLIRHHNNGMLCLFVTLTYDNHYIPYLKQSDLMSDEVLVPVYRDYNVRWYTDRCFSYKVSDPICYLRSFDINYCDGDYLPILKKKRGSIGLALYSDLQCFLKRLRINILRSFHDINLHSYWAVSEYGGTTFRPHFHLLLYFDKGTLEDVRPILVKSWTYGDLLRSDKRIQVALDPSSYLSGYVNKSSSLPKICKSAAFETSFSHSTFFGFGESNFSLSSLLQNVERGSLSFSYEKVKDAVPVLVHSPIPKYVVNRYFPKFKGYSLFAPDEVRECLLSPEALWDKLGDSDILMSYDSTDFCETGYVLHHQITYRPYKDCLIHLSRYDFELWCRKLQRAIDYYIQQTGKTKFDYIIDYLATWSCWYSTVLRLSFDGVTDWFDFYTNIDQYIFGTINAPTLPRHVQYNLNVNSVKSQVRNDRFLRAQYLKQQNIRQTNGFVLSSVYDDM